VRGKEQAGKEKKMKRMVFDFVGLKVIDV